MNYSFFNSLNPECVSASIVNSTNVPEGVCSFGNRTVQKYELDYIISGNGVIISDNVEYPAKKGSLFFRRPGMQVEGILPYQCYYVVINLSDNIHIVNIPDNFPTVILYNETAEIENLFTNLYMEYISDREVSKLFIKNYLMQIFCTMFNQLTYSEQLKNREELHTDYDVITEIANIIKHNPSHNFSLDEMARHSNYSKYTFCRLFKKNTGETPITYINSYRMYEARRMLLETNMSVKEILYTCGYKNESHFYNVFQKNSGCTPLEYRKNGRLWLK